MPVANTRTLKDIHRRIFLITLAQIIIYLVLITRLFFLQIVKHNRYKTLSNKNRVRSLILLPKRGSILDRYHNVIADTKSSYRIVIDRKNVKNINQIIQNVAYILNINKYKLDYYTLAKRYSNQTGIVVIHNNLKWQQVVKLELNKVKIEETEINIFHQRDYKKPEIFSHLIGYVSAVNKNKIKQTRNYMMMHPDFRIGVKGVEKIYDEILLGKSGVEYVEVDAIGLPIRKLNITENKTQINGQNLILTIDAQLQQYIYKLLSDYNGASCIMDIDTGDILAMVSKPGFDSNIFSDKLSTKQWKEIADSPDKILTNRVMQAHYPPGSIYKIISSLTALENGFQPETEFTCEGFKRLGRRKFNCWKEYGHGNLDLTQALEQSCNVYYYNLAHYLDIDYCSQIASELGLGELVNLGFDEVKGIVPTKQYKKKVTGDRWRIGDMYNNVIGQGFLRLTPMQMMIMIARVASGYKVQPRITTQQKIITKKTLNISKYSLDVVRNGLFNVVNGEKGTAKWSAGLIRQKKYIMTQNIDNIHDNHNITKERIKMAGKTGTAQVISRETRERMMRQQRNADNQEILYNNHSIFVGYVPFDKPKYAVATLVEQAGSGSRFAAPITAQIFNYLLKKDEMMQQKLKNNMAG